MLNPKLLGNKTLALKIQEKTNERQTEYSPNNNTRIETLQEQKGRLRSIWIVHIGTFIFSLSFSVVITGVYPYLRQVRMI